MSKSIKCCLLTSPRGSYLWSDIVGKRPGTYNGSLEIQGVDYELFKAVDSGVGEFSEDHVLKYAGLKRQRKMDVRPKPTTRSEWLEMYERITADQDDGLRLAMHERLRFGCYLSACDSVEKLVATGELPALILEDDALLVDDGLERLRLSLSRLPASWGLLYLNACYTEAGSSLAPGLTLSRGSLCTSSYVISYAAASQP